MDGKLCKSATFWHQDHKNWEQAFLDSPQAASTNWLKNLPRLSGLSPEKVHLVVSLKKKPSPAGAETGQVEAEQAGEVGQKLGGNMLRPLSILFFQSNTISGALSAHWCSYNRPCWSWGGTDDHIFLRNKIFVKNEF